MSEPRDELQAGAWQRLHPFSALFVAAHLLRHVALPVLAAVVFGRGSGWEVWAAVPLGLTAIWAVLQASRYRYALQGGELVIHEGVLGRSVRHVPLARIHNTSRTRKLPHRLLGVTELHLESASGGKPEAVMKVLGQAAALRLEQALRGTPQGGSAAQAAGPVTVDPPMQLLHRLGSLDILKLGLISNRGMVIVGAAFAALAQKPELHRRFFGWLSAPTAWVRQGFMRLVESGHWLWLAADIALLLLAFLVFVRTLSVVLAFFRYQGFRLEQDGEKLLVHRGLSTQVTATARLPRLQRWELVETWLHRRFGRCRLAVSVAGHDSQDHEHGLDPGGRFDELAPIATPQEARALLRLCLPALQWEQLQWQPPPAQAFWRQLWGQGRFLIIALLALVVVDIALGQRVPLPGLLAAGLALSAGLWAYCHAWVRFAAYAECGELLLYRHGVLTRRWVVVSGSRLQQLSLYSSALDRSLGLCHLRADSQGSGKGGRALDIPCLPLAEAQRLRARLWGQVLRPY
ncbi:PH domain-containing protein [Mitsuaria sp. WAJ17]|uniref:PH domain-containing protein n=1 Tax=Mitsuaria sp. WAJ17 TaxID=2761452 RepID=UPI0015FEEA8F|nr:PH domain-containing protein [Mitsuaria sp. WAJ17]MBB2487308.1 PH domain-containing protein [Mitsuaria sp. WAJ17]